MFGVCNTPRFDKITVLRHSLSNTPHFEKITVLNYSLSVYVWESLVVCDKTKSMTRSQCLRENREYDFASVVCFQTFTDKQMQYIRVRT